MRKVDLALSLTALALALPASAQAGEVYAKAGFLGVGVGYAQGINERFTLRGDITTMGTYHHKGSTGKFDYDASLRNNQAMLYGDWFPFNSGFRLTAGLGVRDTSVKGHALPKSNGQITVGDTRIGYDSDDRVNAKVKFPTFAPYFGIGWGHNAGQQRQPGWGFLADLGVTYGKPDVSFTVNPSVYAKLEAASSGYAQQEIDKQKHKTQHSADKFKFFPSAYVGVSYAF